MAQSRSVLLCLAILCLVEGDRYYGDYGDRRDLSTRRRVRTRVTVRRRKIRPVTVLSTGFDGSYASVGGTARRKSVYVANSRPATGRDRVILVNSGQPAGVASTVYVPGVSQVAAVGVGAVRTAYQPLVPAYQPLVPAYQPGNVGTLYPSRGQPRIPSGAARDRLPLPKCSYINTDFPGDDLIFEGEDEPGVNAGSARGCKARCKLEDLCVFWSYREGNNRDTASIDCFLKEGTPGLPVPRAAVPRIGFVSGTMDNNCVCIKSEDEEDEVCPIKNPRGLVYPWRNSDEDAQDYDRDLPPLGWNRGVYGGLDPRLTPYLGINNNLENSVRDLRRQLDILTRTLDG